jgi:ribosomal protein S18 acetylase RimI-like enzyme
MTVSQPTDAVTVEPLGPADLVEAFGFLDEDPVLNVYVLALLLRDGLRTTRDEYWGARRGGRTVGLLHLGGQSGAVLPTGEDPDAIRLLAERFVARRGAVPHRFQVIGPRVAVGAFVERLRRAGVTPRLHRHQVYMSLRPRDIAPFERLPELRQATPEDQALVHDSGAALRAEELEEDPRLADPAGYARRVEEECRDGYTRLWTDAQGLCFRASVSARTADAAQVSGVYVPPERRGRGLAVRGMSELCSRLAEHSRELCLFVNDFNIPAIAAYRHVGFRERAAWASALYALSP